MERGGGKVEVLWLAGNSTCAWAQLTWQLHMEKAVSSIS